MASWYTCGNTQCNAVFWADREPFNGHRLSCTKCWLVGCPLNGEPCSQCMTDAKVTIIMLDRLVNGPPKENE